MKDTNTNPAERNRAYRYKVDLLNAEVTPLAVVVAYWGQDQVRVQNISMGGAAFIFDREPPAKVGDIVSLSIAIRDHAFPVQIEVRAILGLKLHCAFVDPPKNFQAALKEFLKPKFLGESLSRNAVLSNRPDVLVMVPEAHIYEAFLGLNETAVFVWTSRDRTVLRFVAVSGEWIMEWDQGVFTALSPGEEALPRLRTGLRKSAAEEALGGDEPAWHRLPDPALRNHFADILLAWLKFEGASHFVERIVRDGIVAVASPTVESPLVFPII